MKKTKSGGRSRKYIFLACIIAVCAFAIFGDKGILEVYRLRGERDGILSFNKALEDENRTLDESIRLLKADKRYIGYIARKELGMIGKNEVVYRFEEAK